MKQPDDPLPKRRIGILKTGSNAGYDDGYNRDYKINQPSCLALALREALIFIIALLLSSGLLKLVNFVLERCQCV